MNKFMLLFIGLMCFSSLDAQIIDQCSISGDGIISLNQTANYSVSPSLAQCNDCFDWDVSPSSAAEIVGSDQNNTVSIRRVGPGNITITVTYLNENGCHTCSVIIHDTIGGSCIPPAINPCNQLQDVPPPIDGTSCGLILELSSHDPNASSILWNATYANGSTASYLYRSDPSFVPPYPQMVSRHGFFEACQGNPIVRLVISQTCLNGTVLTSTRNFSNGGCYVAVGEIPGGGDGFELGGSGFKSLIYPNPANDVLFLNIEKDNTNVNSYKIFDYSGNLKIEQKLSGSLEIKISELQAGKYILQLISTDGQIETEIFIKE